MQDDEILPDYVRTLSEIDLYKHWLALMTEESSHDLTKSSHPLKYPWWEPYLFTGGVLLVFVIVLVAFGYVAGMPYTLPILCLLATVSAVVDAFRRSSTDPTVVGKVLLAIFFTLASDAYFSKAESLLGLWFAGMALVWLCLSIHAGMIQRAHRRERLAKLDRAVVLGEKRKRPDQ